jgi:hypothetical protein
MCHFNNFPGLLGSTDLWWYQDPQDFNLQMWTLVTSLMKVQ